MTNHSFSRTVVGLASFNTSTISHVLLIFQVTFPTGWFLYNVELSLVTEFTADTVVNQVCTHAVVEKNINPPHIAQLSGHKNLKSL